MRSHVLRLLLAQVALFAVTLAGVAPAQAQLRPEAEALKAAPQELVDRIEQDPIAYFRFVNRPWIGRVCESSPATADLPVVRLHGDAHVEQFAVTSKAWGLDDFDDSARGPASSTWSGSSDRSTWSRASAAGRRTAGRFSIGSSKDTGGAWPTPTHSRRVPPSSCDCVRSRHLHRRSFSPGASR